MPPPSPPLVTATAGEAAAVTATVVLAVTVEEFDEAAFKETLAASVNVTVDDIVLTVESASIRVTMTIKAASSVHANRVYGNLATTLASPAAASVALGVQVSAIHTPPSTTTVNIAFPPPSSPPKTATDLDDFHRHLWFSAVGLLALVFAIGAAASGYYDIVNSKIVKKRRGSMLIQPLPFVYDEDEKKSSTKEGTKTEPTEQSKV